MSFPICFSSADDLAAKHPLLEALCTPERVHKAARELRSVKGDPVDRKRKRDNAAAALASGTPEQPANPSKKKKVAGPAARKPTTEELAAGKAAKEAEEAHWVGLYAERAAAAEKLEEEINEFTTEVGPYLTGPNGEPPQKIVLKETPASAIVGHLFERATALRGRGAQGAVLGEKRVWIRQAVRAETLQRALVDQYPDMDWAAKHHESTVNVRSLTSLSTARICSF